MSPRCEPRGGRAAAGTRAARRALYPSWPALGGRGSAPAVLIFLVLLAWPAAAADRSFAIERFAVVIDVHPDGGLAVQETLTVSFRGRHNGIFRSIPVRDTRHGFELGLRLHAIVVLDEAHQPLRTEVSYPGRSVRIKAWVPGAENTTKTVRILYRVRQGLLAFDDHDELYWNVTGDEWDAPIRQAEATVTLPARVSDGVHTIAYTGPRGAAGTDWTEERWRGTIAVRTTRALRPREGLTIVVGWPRGAIARPPAWRQAWWFLGDHWPLALPGVALVLMGLVWSAYGRDPRLNRSIKPEYGPPPGLLPAEAGALIDERAEPQDVVATLIDLAVRGYLEIERTAGADDDFVFRRAKPLAGDPHLTLLERFILKKVFGENLSLRERSLAELRGNADYVFGPIRDAIERALMADRLFHASPFWVRQAWGVIGVVLLFIAGGALFIEIERLAVLGVSLPIGLALSGLVVLGFSRIMPRRTWRGVRLLAHLRGFQEFLERAEKDRLERLPADTLHRWLPWAIALGVTERWIHGFQGMPVQAPAWYRAREPFDLTTYGRGLERFRHRVQDALLTGPRGASSGVHGRGGGFSGGASGGGRGGGGGGSF